MTADGNATDSSRTTNIRLADVMAMLSTATDLAMSHPADFAISSCVISLRLGEALGYPDSILRDIYYQALLRFIGCNAETAMFAAIVGDEILLRNEIATIDMADRGAVMRLMVRSIRGTHAGESPLAVTRAVIRGLASLPGVTKEYFTSHCEVAQQLATRLGFEPSLVEGLGQLYERWDGKGSPRGIKGEMITPAVRVVSLVQDALIFHGLGGIDFAIGVVRERSGAAYDPTIAERFCTVGPRLLADTGTQVDWSDVIALEPGARKRLSDLELDGACAAIADFADIKSTFMAGHSHRVARLAEQAAATLNLPSNDRVAIKRAGLVHDVGRCAISSLIWSKAAALSEREWDQVRLHPYHTQRILARPAAFAPVAAIAAAQCERMDGSGYHRAIGGTSLSVGARVLSVADTYVAMTEERPYRAALSPDRAATELRSVANGGKLDPEIVDAVLSVSGHRARAASFERMGGLTEREIEVLRLLALGKSKREIAADLSIATKTADNHVQHVYEKIGVTTRAGATLYAVERGLLG